MQEQNKQKLRKNLMTKLCPRGKAAAKRKFKVIPVHMLMHTLVKFVQVKLKIQEWCKEKRF